MAKRIEEIGDPWSAMRGQALAPAIDRLRLTSH
jgi:hypothetical protein